MAIYCMLTFQAHINPYNCHWVCFCFTSYCWVPSSVLYTLDHLKCIKIACEIISLKRPRNTLIRVAAYDLDFLKDL